MANLTASQIRWLAEFVDDLALEIVCAIYDDEARRRMDRAWAKLGGK